MSRPSVAVVVRGALCTGCGTCHAFCPEGAIDLRLEEPSGRILPRVDEDRCTGCGTCLEVCPGSHWDRVPRGDRPGEELLGPFRAVMTGCSAREEVRRQGASGGVVTELLSFLLQEGRVDGAVVSRVSWEEPLRTRTSVVRTDAELRAAQRSIYFPVPAAAALRDLRHGNERLAFVGLPCHLAGLEKAAALFPEVRERLVFRLGLFCSRTPTAAATRRLFRRLGVDPREVTDVAYRGEGHPGRLRVTTRGGRVLTVEHLDPRYWGHDFLKFFKPPRCWLCHDHSAEEADLSFADDWTGQGPGVCGGGGSSMVVARTAVGEEALAAAAAAGRLALRPLEPARAAAVQALAAKSNVRPRRRLWRMLGHALPRTSPPPPGRDGFAAVLAEVPELLRVLASASGRHPVVTEAAILLSRGTGAAGRSLRRAAAIPRRAAALLLALVPARRTVPPRRGRRKIVMIGGYGWADIGDEAMPRADLINLRRRAEGLEVVMLSPNPEHTAAYHGERSVEDVTNLGLAGGSTLRGRLAWAARTGIFLAGAAAERFGVSLRLWPSARRAMDELAGADLLFNVGGGNLTSVIPEELYKKCTTYLAARLLGKPVILSGQTIGPFTRAGDARWARLALNRVDFISFRDRETSAGRLREIGVTRPVMIDAADDAFTLPAVPAREAAALLRAAVPEAWWSLEREITVALNLKGSLALYKGAGRGGGLEAEVERMAALAARILEERRARVFFLPTDYCPGVDDREVHRRIAARLGARPDVALVEAEHEDRALKGILALADAALGARYHFNVFAAAEGVPFLGMASGVYQRTKLKGLADLCGLPECFLAEDLEHADPEDLWRGARRVLDARDAIRRRLRERAPALAEASLAGVEEALRKLGLDGGSGPGGR